MTMTFSSDSTHKNHRCDNGTFQHRFPSCVPSNPVVRLGYKQRHLGERNNSCDFIWIYNIETITIFALGQQISLITLFSNLSQLLSLPVTNKNRGEIDKFRTSGSNN